MWAEGHCCSDVQRTYSDRHRDERGQVVAETVGKHYVMCLGMFGGPPNMYLNWSLKFEVYKEHFVPEKMSNKMVDQNW